MNKYEIIEKYYNFMKDTGLSQKIFYEILEMEGLSKNGFFHFITNPFDTDKEKMDIIERTIEIIKDRIMNALKIDIQEFKDIYYPFIEDIKRIFKENKGLMNTLNRDGSITHILSKSRFNVKTINKILVVLRENKKITWYNAKYIENKLIKFDIKFKEYLRISNRKEFFDIIDGEYYK